jgi:hypothetical protein
VAVTAALVAAAQTSAQHPVAADQVAPRPTPTPAVPVAQAASSSRTRNVADKKIPVALLDGSCVWVDDKDAAALAGLEKLPYGRKEFAGAIYQRKDGKFCYSETVPGTMDDFEFATDPTAGKFAGLFHSHHGDDEEQFSPKDVHVATELNRTSYIRGNKSGNVRRYEPGIDRPQRDNHMGDSIAGTTKVLGTLVGNTKTRREQLEAAYDLHNPANPEVKK